MTDLADLAATARLLGTRIVVVGHDRDTLVAVIDDDGTTERPDS